MTRSASPYAAAPSSPAGSAFRPSTSASPGFGDQGIDDALQRAALRLCAIDLTDIASEASASSDSRTESDLDRGREEIRNALAALDAPGTSLSVIRSHMQRGAITISYALSLGGLGRDVSVTELRIRLAACSNALEKDADIATS